MKFINPGYLLNGRYRNESGDPFWRALRVQFYNNIPGDEIIRHTSRFTEDIVRQKVRIVQRELEKHEAPWLP